jgi:hypothetical protein
MAFDIYQLDDLESDDFDKLLAEYQDALGELFFYSPEGQALRQVDPDMGFWSGQLIDYGYSYIGVTIPQMRVTHIEELLTEVFPRKITLHTPEDADDALPELIAFWEYLQREYQLPASGEILAYLRGLKPQQFTQWMNDPSRFGMAKSFTMAGKNAGFDMTSEKGLQAFQAFYNANLPRFGGLSDNLLLPLLPEDDWEPGFRPDVMGSGHGKKTGLKAKHKRKMAKASRKKNRKRK